MTKLSKHEIEHLIDRYVGDKCNRNEENKLFELLSDSENESAFKEVITSYLERLGDSGEENHLIDFEYLYSKLDIRIKEKQIRESEKQLLINKERNRRNLRLAMGLISMAAVSLIAFFIGTLFQSNKYETLSVPVSSMEYYEFRAPIGSKSEIRLSDGTEVILNAGSTLRYQIDYNLYNRDLVLKGEAYFKVSKNQKLPFIVSTDDLIIKATGTEFNVKAYSEEGTTEATLIEGEVEISEKGSMEKNQTIILKPNQKAIYLNESDKLSLEEVRKTEPLAIKPDKFPSEKLLVSPSTDIEQAIAWVNNELIIKSEDLETLCIKLQRKYDVKFIFKDEQAKQFRFNGTLLDETFEQVMEAIRLTAPIDYSVEGKTVMLSTDIGRLKSYSGEI